MHEWTGRVGARGLTGSLTHTTALHQSSFFKHPWPGFASWVNRKAYNDDPLHWRITYWNGCISSGVNVPCIYLRTRWGPCCICVFQVPINSLVCWFYIQMGDKKLGARWNIINTQVHPPPPPPPHWIANGRIHQHKLYQTPPPPPIKKQKHPPTPTQATSKHCSLPRNDTKWQINMREQYQTSVALSHLY